MAIKLRPSPIVFFKFDILIENSSDCFRNSFDFQELKWNVPTPFSSKQYSYILFLIANKTWLQIVKTVLFFYGRASLLVNLKSEFFFIWKFNPEMKIQIIFLTKFSISRYSNFIILKRIILFLFDKIVHNCSCLLNKCFALKLNGMENFSIYSRHKNPRHNNFHSLFIT